MASRIQINKGGIAVVSIIALTIGIYAAFNKPSEQPKFYESQCAAIVEEDFDNLDALCAAFSSDTEFDTTALEPLLRIRDQKLATAGCNPQDEIWSCYRGYQRHYASREPNRKNR